MRSATLHGGWFGGRSVRKAENWRISNDGSRNSPAGHGFKQFVAPPTIVKVVSTSPLRSKLDPLEQQNADISTREWPTTRRVVQVHARLTTKAWRNNHDRNEISTRNGLPPAADKHAPTEAADPDA